MNTISLEIITPEKIAFSDNEVTYIRVPSASGELGILPHHVALFSKLTGGEVKINKGKEEFFLAIGGGFIEVFNNKVKILVTRAVHAKELNEKEVLEAQKRAQEMLKQKPTGEVLQEAQNLYRSALIDLKVLTRLRGIRRPVSQRGES